MKQLDLFPWDAPEPPLSHFWERVLSEKRARVALREREQSLPPPASPSVLSGGTPIYAPEGVREVRPAPFAGRVFP